MFKKLLSKLLPGGSANPVKDGRYYPIPVAGDMNAARVKATLENAVAGNLQDLFQLYEDMILTDDHLQGELRTRKVAILGDELNIRAKAPKNPADVAAADAANAAWEAIPNGMDALKWLLESMAYPVAVLERWYEPAPPDAKGLRLIPRLQEVPFHLLDWTAGRLRVRITRNGMPVEAFLETGDQESSLESLETMGVSGPDGKHRFICHRAHLLSALDQRGGPMRSLIFWWLFKTQTREWWNSFLARFGAPFLVGKYDSMDERSKHRLQQAFSQAVRLFGLVVSRETEIEMLQAVTNSSGDAYARFLDLADQHISRFFLGQTFSSGTSTASGLGSGQSNLAGAVRNDLRDYDSKALAQTLQHQLFRPLLDLHGLSGRIVVSWGAEDVASMAETNESLKSCAAVGLEPDDEALGTIGRRFGYGVRRVQSLPPVLVPRDRLSGSVGGPVPPHIAARRSAEAVFAAATADLAAAFGGHAAAIRRGLRLAQSPQDLLASLEQDLPALPPQDRAGLMARAFAEAAAHTL